MDYEYPVFDVSDAEIAFGVKDQKRYIPASNLEKLNFYNANNLYTKAVNGLFFKGGTLEEYGLTIKPEIDKSKAERAIIALLRSWGPKHEVKVGTVGYALSQWCNILKWEKSDE